MSSYMRGWSKRKPYLANRLNRGHRMKFMSAPVRCLLESLERESAMEKPYLEGGPQRKHQIPPGQSGRFEDSAQSSYPMYRSWNVEYNRPECELFVFSLDCDDTPLANININYGAGWQTGQDITFGVSCNRADLIRFDPVHFSSYWSSASLEGEWITKPTGPMELSCVGSVFYQGAWAASEIKREMTIVSESTMTVTTSFSPGVSGGVASQSIVGRMGNRGNDIHILREYDLDPTTTSLDGHDSVTSSAKTSALVALVSAGFFNNAYTIGGSYFTSETSQQIHGRLDWLRAPGTITGWYGGQLSCPPVVVDVSCNDEKCEDYNNALTRFAWDSLTSAETISAGGAGVTVAVSGGVGPYVWSVSPEEFSLAVTETTGLTNTLYSDGSSCGFAGITVTDACGASTFGAVRETGGVNTDWTMTQPCGVETGPPLYTRSVYGIDADGGLIMDDWCGGSEGSSQCEDNCTASCPQTVPGIPNFPIMGSSTSWLCEVEDNLKWVWECT